MRVIFAIQCYVRPMSQEKAKALRKRQTDAERKLWSAIRDRQLAGTKFRRQVPFGPYIADFVSHERHLIVEVDGGQHALAEFDTRRTAFLEAEGYCVVRFWNNEVLKNLPGVLGRLMDYLDQ